jgi:putative ABC transport system permease protein
VTPNPVHEVLRFALPRTPKMKALDRKLFRDLLNFKGQVIAIALVVACGIASLVTMLSAYDSLKLSQETYYKQYLFAEVFDQLIRAPNSLERRIQEIPGVQQVRTRVVESVTLDVPGLTEPATGQLVSIPEQQRPMLNDLYLRSGRYIQPQQSNEVLVSEAFAIANGLEVGDTIGAILNGSWEELRIVGIALSPEFIYEIGPNDIFPDNRRFGVIWMGYGALSNAFDLNGAFNDVILTLMPNVKAEEVIERLDTLLKPYQFITDEIESLQATAVIVPIIFLGIAAFLLNLLLARLVSTQREQIAVLKAFGYSNSVIGLHYLKLVLVVVMLGGIIGTSIGLWFGFAVTLNYANFYHFPVLKYQAGVGLVLTAIAVSGGAAVLGALTTVHRVVSLPPAQAMRPEAPAQFRPTLLERMGLQGLLSPPGRIILRNLERQIIKALLSGVGIAMAVAILVVGLYFQNAIDYIIQVQFFTIQREDVTIVFNEPQPNRTRYELLYLPGVMRSEPFRTVPAHLKSQHRSYRTGILGLEPEGNLRQLVDRELRRVSLPPHGVLLSKKLAQLLKIRPGELLQIEVLEGERPTRTVQVMGTVDDLIGVSVYMDIQALNQLMREDRTITGAYLAVDEFYLELLYSQLKQTPGVGGVAIQQTAIEQFQDTIASSLMIFNTVLVIFACIIAFGVVYNAARIALSERERELATLRIIGFSQAEIAGILLGEQGIITLLAIPVGWGVGYGFCALLSETYNTELYRIPLVVNRSTYFLAFLVVAIAGVFSGFLIWRHLTQLDLVAVLKTRE